MKKTVAVVLVGAVLALFTGTALAAPEREVETKADLDGAQETPPVATEMTGEVEIEIEDGELHFDLEVDDNSHDIFAAHVHCGVPGTNGPVGITLFTGSFTDDDGRVAKGSLAAPDPGNGCGWGDLDDVGAAIASGSAYVNVHTTAESGGVPSGEIRGNLGTDLEVETKADLDGAQESPAVATEMTGEVEIEIEDGELEFDLEVDDNSGEVVAAHIHCGPPGVNGPVGVTLFTGSFTDDDGTVAKGSLAAPDAGNGCGWVDLDDVAAAIAAGSAYVNVHTAAFGPGEIRGDL